MLIFRVSAALFIRTNDMSVLCTVIGIAVIRAGNVMNVLCAVIGTAVIRAAAVYLTAADPAAAEICSVRFFQTAGNQ